MLDAVGAVAAVTVVAKAVEDMAGPHPVRCHVRHADRVKATMDRLNLQLTSLGDKKVDIVAKIAADPGNHSMKKEL